MKLNNHYLILIIFLILLSTGCSRNFKLDSKYYNDGKLMYIDSSKLNELIENKNSFAILVYERDNCIKGNEFGNIMRDYAVENNITIFEISFRESRNSKIKGKVDSFPTVALFKKGKLFKYLNPDNDSDTQYYNSVEDFGQWFAKYIILE